MALFVDEEDHYVRLSLLLTGVSPRAVRFLFDKEFAPAVLSSTLKRERKTLLDLNNRRIINQTQWNLLFNKPDSKHFDVSLMICLLTNITSIRGYEKPGLPVTTDTSIGADLARIRYYRNYLSHLTDSKVDDTQFPTAWNDITRAIDRLSGSAMVNECHNLRTKILDQSNREIMLEVKQSNDEIRSIRQSFNTLKRSNDSQRKKINSMKKELKRRKTDQKNLESAYAMLKRERQDTIPRNIREQMKAKIAQWKKDDAMFVKTRGSRQILDCVKTSPCVTITGSFGVGKTFILRHIALQMAAAGYDIIPISNPDDVFRFYDADRHMLFLVDDFCGKYSLIENDFRKWKRSTGDIELLLKGNKIKIVVALRLQVFQDKSFKTVQMYNSCICDLTSNFLLYENECIAIVYLKNNADRFRFGFGSFYDFFPLLCRRYMENPKADILDYPFSVCIEEIQNLANEKYYLKYCALALFVMLNNSVYSCWFDDEDESDDVCDVIEATLKQCNLPPGTSKKLLRDEIQVLEGTFTNTRVNCITWNEIPSPKNKFSWEINEFLFDHLVCYFGKIMIKCLVMYADFSILSERFVFDKQEAMTPVHGYDTLVIPKVYWPLYIERFIKSWSKGLRIVSDNINLVDPNFRELLLKRLTELDNKCQTDLARKTNTTFRGDIFISSLLVAFCECGDIKLTKWFLDNGANVNQHFFRRMSPLQIASKQGKVDNSHFYKVDIVKLLLQHEANVNLINHFGQSPLTLATIEGHVEIVKILLDHNAKIRNDYESHIFGCHDWTELIIACNMGHYEIVKILYKHYTEKGYNYSLEKGRKCFSDSPKFLRSLQIIDHINKEKTFKSCDF